MGPEASTSESVVVVAAVLAVLFARTDSTSLALRVVALYTFVQLAESYLVLPMVMRRAVDLHRLTDDRGETAYGHNRIRA